MKESTRFWEVSFDDAGMAQYIYIYIKQYNIPSWKIRGDFKYERQSRAECEQMDLKSNESTFGSRDMDRLHPRWRRMEDWPK